MEAIETDKAVEFLETIPALHRDGAWSGGVNPRPAREMAKHLEALDKPALIETGAGSSTLLFMALGCGSVTSIAPDAKLGERIREEAIQRDLDLDVLTFIKDRSERALPKLAAERVRCQAAFIDGDHGFPAVFVDFCYLNMMLDRDGILFVDDVQIHSCAQLVLLLRAQPEYEFVSLVGKMATFRKVSDRPFLPNHRGQPFVMTSSVGVQP